MGEQPLLLLRISYLAAALGEEVSVLLLLLCGYNGIEVLHLHSHGHNHRKQFLALNAGMVLV